MVDELRRLLPRSSWEAVCLRLDNILILQRMHDALERLSLAAQLVKARVWLLERRTVPEGPVATLLFAGPAISGEVPEFGTLARLLMEKMDRAARDTWKRGDEIAPLEAGVDPMVFDAMTGHPPTPADRAAFLSAALADSPELLQLPVVQQLLLEQRQHGAQPRPQSAPPRPAGEDPHGEPGPALRSSSEPQVALALPERFPSVFGEEPTAPPAPPSLPLDPVASLIADMDRRLSVRVENSMVRNIRLSRC